MRNKTFNKLLLILMITMLLAADFLTLSYNLISYAAESDNKTNHENIEFSAYFKNNEGTKVTNINESIKKTDLKLYAEVTVKNEGYFNGTIELQEGNFNIKNNILSSDISSIEGNKVNLKQINAGETAQIELAIEPIIAATIDANMLSMDSVIKLTGEYTETTNNLLGTNLAKTPIDATKTINVNFQVDESAQAELITDIITNTILSVSKTNKRVVQLLVKSRLTENQYPVSQTVLEVEVPTLSDKQPEKVEVLALGTKATNGGADSIIEDAQNVNGKVTITLKNEPNENKISWNKNVYDELVVTLIYAEDVDATDVEIKTNSEIKLHNSSNTYTATHTKSIENKTLNNVITTQIEDTSVDIYKGQLYVNANTGTTEEVEYSTKTILNITNINVTDKISIKEGPDAFGTSDSKELVANTKFISIQINKQKMLDLLGQNGTIQISDGTITQNISSATEANESGNIEIKYTTAANQLEIAISHPVKAGVLEINHTKSITANSYTVSQLKTIDKLILRDTVTGTLSESEIVKNSAESSLGLKETETKAELTVSQDSLSTMTTNNNVTLGVKLITNGTQYDLYKNPNIQIQLPSCVEEVTANGTISKLYADEFGVQTTYNSSTKLIQISLTGEQTSYPTGDAAQAYLQLSLNLRFSKLQPSKTDKIVMTYTNDNATIYAGGTTSVGIVEKEIKIVSLSGLIPVNNLETYNIEGIAGISENKQVVEIDKDTAGGTDVKYNISLINNTNSDANNVKILGVLPTEGEFVSGTETIKNTLSTSLISINASNATVYYSNNINATIDLNDVANGWNPNLSEVSNPKSYLIEIATIPIESRYDASYTVTLPSTLDYDMVAYAGYQVSYNEGTSVGTQNVYSTLAGITTEAEIKLETALSAKVGNDTLKDGDMVKAGEVINYTATVKNNGTQTLENVVVKAGVPTGTVVVVPEEGYKHTGLSYFKEQTELTEVTETISSLGAGKEYTMTYQVRVNMDITNGTKLTNKSIAQVEDVVEESQEINNFANEAKLRVTVKNLLGEEPNSLAGDIAEYTVYAENLSNETINDLNIQLIFTGQSFVIETRKFLDATIQDNVINIKEIPANGKAGLTFVTSIDSDVTYATLVAIATDKEGNTYRSNKDISNYIITDADISLTSPTEGKYVNIGDEIQYNILVKNKSNVATIVKVLDNIPEELFVKKVYVNDQLKMQIFDNNDTETYVNQIVNNFEYHLSLQANESVNVKIITGVKYTEENFNIKTIKNSAQIKILDELRDTSEEVSHIIKGTLENEGGEIQNIISGVAWLDENENGQKDAEEKLLSNINVKLFNVLTNSIATDKENNIAETTTNENGEYSFVKILEGEYIVLFEFDTTKYELTTYMKEGVQESQNSNVVLKTIEIDGQEKVFAVTDKIKLTEDLANINIGLKEKTSFDLELDKYISRIVVQNNKGTKAYDYTDSTFEKVEIHSKQINNSMVVFEYTIRVKNAGEVAGSVRSIVDYLPSGLEFSSELNSDWYLSGTNLYTKVLANDKIQPGETRDIKLILTKKMTENNIGLINNRAEIEEYFNELGRVDIDSTANNLANNEDDLGVADVIISISTGATTIIYSLLVIINTGLIAFAVYLIFIKNRRKI